MLKRRRRINLFCTTLLLLLGLFLLIPAMFSSSDALLAPGIVGALAVVCGTVGLWVKQRSLLALVALPIGTLLTFVGLVDFQNLGSLCLLGVIGLILGAAARGTYKTAHLSTLSREAAFLLHIRSYLPEDSFPPVSFAPEGVYIGDGEAIPYSECESAFETLDLYLFLRNDRALLLQKKELVNGTPAQFSAFLSHHLDLIYCI